MLPQEVLIAIEGHIPGWFGAFSTGCIDENGKGSLKPQKWLSTSGIVRLPELQTA
jgi:hypothetical protein